MYVKVSELLAEYSADTIYEITQDVHCWYESTDVYFRAKIIPFAVGYGANHYAFNPVTSGWDREVMSTPGHLSYCFLLNVLIIQLAITSLA